MVNTAKRRGNNEVLYEETTLNQLCFYIWQYLKEKSSKILMAQVYTFFNNFDLKITKNMVEIWIIPNKLQYTFGFQKWKKI